jgi:lipoprotein-anchoring transpeptidase ErfK/SrfK
MSLPSQSSRNATRSSQVHYRRSRKNPARRAISAIIVVAILFAIWYTLIRPSGSTDPVELGQGENATALTDPGSAAAPGTAPSTREQPAISSNSPSRPLPDTGAQPNPNQEVDRILGTNTEPQTTRQANIPSTTSTDIFDSATEQANTANSPSTNTRPPANRPQVEDRNTTLRGVQLQLDTARRLIAENDRVGARALLSRTLINADLSEAERQTLRDELTIINQRLVFSPTGDPNDPMVEQYKVQSGDSLSRIAGRRELATHWKLIARVNQISDPSKIRLGQTLKLVRGPFHAIVDKSDHRLDIYHGSPNDPSTWLYIRSFDVGLGTADGTPVGEFVVSANKLENPGWVNPRNAREQYAPNDPENPIGEFWIGLTGVGQYSDLESYGIHGTIDPDSIGSDQSMGCVRLAKGDIDVVYELLAEHISRVLIVP